jgi:glutaminyl-tRNA synthetase
METAGPKFFRLTVGGTVRLKGAYIIRAAGVEKDKDGNVIRVLAEIVEGTKSGIAGGEIKTKATIHFVDSADCVIIKARLYDHLLIEGGEDLDFSQRLNPDSLIEKTAFAEAYIKESSPGQAFQFLRLAYFVRDTKEDGLVFNRVVGLKDSKGK